MSQVSDETLKKGKLQEIVTSIKNAKGKFLGILKQNNIAVVKGNKKQTVSNIINAIKGNKNFAQDLSEIIVAARKGKPATSSYSGGQTMDKGLSYPYTGNDPEVLATADTLQNAVSILGDTLSTEILSLGLSEQDLKEETNYTPYIIAAVILLVILAIVFRKKIAQLF